MNCKCKKCIGIIILVIVIAWGKTSNIAYTLLSDY